MNTTSSRQLTADLQNVIDDAEALLKETASETGSRIAGVRNRLGASLDNARGRLSDMEDAVIAQTRAAARSTDRYVHENPWQTIGIAAGIGVALGILLSRR